MIGSVADEEDIAKILTPVTLRFNDYVQIAFEIEHDQLKRVVSLPGAPSTWSGSTVIVDRHCVTPLKAPTHQAVKRMRGLDRSSLAFKADSS